MRNEPSNIRMQDREINIKELAVRQAVSLGIQINLNHISETSPNSSLERSWTSPAKSTGKTEGPRIFQRKGGMNVFRDCRGTRRAASWPDSSCTLVPCCLLQRQLFERRNETSEILARFLRKCVNPIHGNSSFTFENLLNFLILVARVLLQQ